MERRRNHPHGRLETVLARLEAVQVRQRHDDSDGPVTAHAEIADVVEKDDPRCAGTVHRLAEERPDHDVGPARFVDDGAAETVELALETVASFR